MTCFCKPWRTRELWFYTSEIFPNETAVSVVQSFTHSCHHTSMLEALRLLQVWYYEVLCFVFLISLRYFLFVLSYSYLPSSVISSPFLPFFTVNLFSLSLPSTPLYFSPFVPSLLCPLYLSVLRLLFLLNRLLVFIICCLFHPLFFYISLSSCCFFFIF